MPIRNIQGQVIGTYDKTTNTVTKYVDPAKHLMKKMNAYGLDVDLYNAIQSSGATVIFNIKGETARRISPETLKAYHHKANYGHGTQCFIGLHHLDLCHS